MLEGVDSDNWSTCEEASGASGVSGVSAASDASEACTGVALPWQDSRASHVVSLEWPKRPEQPEQSALEPKRANSQCYE